MLLHTVLQGRGVLSWLQHEIWFHVRVSLCFEGRPLSAFRVHTLSAQGT